MDGPTKRARSDVLFGAQLVPTSAASRSTGCAHRIREIGQVHVIAFGALPDPRSRSIDTDYQPTAVHRRPTQPLRPPGAVHGAGGSAPTTAPRRLMIVRRRCCSRRCVGEPRIFRHLERLLRYGTKLDFSTSWCSTCWAPTRQRRVTNLSAGVNGSRIRACAARLRFNRVDTDISLLIISRVLV